MNYKCTGCGVKLQSVDKLKDGYIDEGILLQNVDKPYCKRCYDIKHHNSRYQNDVTEDVLFKKLFKIKDTQSLVLLIVDALDLYSGFMSSLKDIIGKNEVIILLNKKDILPKSVRLNKMIEVLKEVGKNYCLNIVDVMPISAISSTDVKRVIEKIGKLKYYNRPYKKTRFKDCYVIGQASVGKSTFINKVLELYLDKKDELTVSDQFQTTLDFIKIPLDQNDFLIDTPGLINAKSYKAYLDYDSIKVLTPKTYIKTRTFQLNDDQTIFIGGLVKMDFIKGGKISATFFVSNDLSVHRTKTVNADRVYENNKYNTCVVPPFNEEVAQKILPFKSNKIILKDDEYYDLIILGVGFVHLKGLNAEINLSMSDKVKFHLVKSII